MKDFFQGKEKCKVANHFQKIKKLLKNLRKLRHGTHFCHFKGFCLALVWMAQSPNSVLDNTPGCFLGQDTLNSQFLFT